MTGLKVTTIYSGGTQMDGLYLLTIQMGFMAELQYKWD